ncbi:MAG: ABC transporter substrate-binding protein [Chloroflexota bacterium]
MVQGRKAFVAVSCLLVLGLLLASCAPAVAPTATPKPAAPPESKAPAAAPTTPPTSKAPAAAPTPQPAAPKPAAPAATPKPAAEAPRYGGVLTIAHPGNPPEMDPWEMTTISTLALNGPVYSQLFQFDPFDNEEAVPDLVEKWEFSPDNKTVTLHLRKGVKWHDGTPFSAADVKYSIDFMMDKKNPKVARKLLNLIAIDKVEVVDADTAKLILRAPSASLLPQLALPHSAIGPKHVAEKAAKAASALDWTVVGTGPMKYKTFVKDSFYEVVKNPDYFIKGRPYLDGIRFFIVTDMATRFAAFRTGQILLTAPNLGLTPPQAETAAKEVKGVRIEKHPRGMFDGFFMNPDRKPWGDARIRKAVNLATDRDAAIKALGEGIGDYGSPVVPGPFALPKDEVMKTPGYRQPKDADRAEAKKLMAEAGFPDGFKSSVMARSWSQYTRIAEFMKDQASKIGIDLTLEVVEQSVERARRFGATPDWNTLVATAAVDNTDPAGANKYFLKGNDFNFYDKEVDELWQKQDAIMDPAERKKVVFQAQRRFLEVSGWVVLFWATNITGVWPQVKNFKPGSGNYTNLKHENTWLAK